MNSEYARRLVDEAELPSLLAALAHAHGDMRYVPKDLWLDPARALEAEDGWSPEQLEAARRLAVEGVSRPVDASCAPEDSLVGDIIDWLTGTDLDDGYRMMLREELAVTGDLRRPEPIPVGAWPYSVESPAVSVTPATAARTRDGASGSDHITYTPVLVIGAGMSGILAAYRLKQAGIDCVVVDKNSDVGGTWFENTYPGCRVDVFNHIYAYSCEQRPDWPEYHSSQPVLLDYFRDCATRWGIRDLIRFNTTVESLEWDDTAQLWRIAIVTSEVPSEIQASAVVSAVGQLNRPLLPDISGTDTFAGEGFHSSSWRHDIYWSDQRVVVIGTGASALQFIPYLAEHAAHVTVFQRTPPWLIPRPQYHKRLPPGLLELFQLLPKYAHWFRLRLFWCTHEGTIAFLRRDPDWKGPLDEAVSAGNDVTRQILTGYLQSQFAGREDLLSQVMPRYPVGAKRVILDNGIWASTLKRPNVELVSEPITQIEPTGVRSGDGTLHEADVIIYGTGFKASEFLMPMQVTGRGGVDLHESWAGDARAYNGVCVPGFPNLFCLYGPNTNIVVNGSIIYFAECGVNFVVECLRSLADRGVSAMDCKPAAYERYSAYMDEQNAKMAWGISDVNSWYKSRSGRIAQNWPLPLIEYWRQTRKPDPKAFTYLPPPPSLESRAQTDSTR